MYSAGAADQYGLPEQTGNGQAIRLRVAKPRYTMAIVAGQAGPLEEAARSAYDRLAGMAGPWCADDVLSDPLPEYHGTTN